MKTKKTVILCGGLTGGPIIPLLAISKNLPYKTIIVDTKNSFGESVSRANNYEFSSLPKAKLSLLTFSNQNLVSMVKGLADAFSSVIKLAYSYIKSLYLLQTKNPAGILSAGGFTAVPIVFAAKTINVLRENKIKIVVHQQDPQVGVTGKIVGKFSDIKSCMFEHTKENYDLFNDSLVIPNPLDYDKFENEITNSKLEEFISNSKKDILLIFGGGSGSLNINNWTKKNVKKLTEKFSVIHLTGLFRDETEIHEQNYFSISSLKSEMGPVMKKSDLVICRAGIGSITELMHLKKPAYLVPLTNSHQELNAKLASDSFETLYESKIDGWLNRITKEYPQKFQTKEFPSSSANQEELGRYYSKLVKLFEKK